METAVFAETMENLQHSMRPILESRNKNWTRAAWKPKDKNLWSILNIKLWVLLCMHQFIGSCRNGFMGHVLTSHISPVRHEGWTFGPSCFVTPSCWNMFPVLDMSSLVLRSLFPSFRQPSLFSLPTLPFPVILTPCIPALHLHLHTVGGTLQTWLAVDGNNIHPF
jgi:hypothetical protein